MTHFFGTTLLVGLENINFLAEKCSKVVSCAVKCVLPCSVVMISVLKISVVKVK